MKFESLISTIAMPLSILIAGTCIYVAIAFATEANKLQEVAANGDKAALAAQFSEVGKSCKACHDDFRAE